MKTGSWLSSLLFPQNLETFFTIEALISVYVTDGEREEGRKEGKKELEHIVVNTTSYSMDPINLLVEIKIIIKIINKP
jgi:hypothetical protein